MLVGRATSVRMSKCCMGVENVGIIQLQVSPCCIGSLKLGCMPAHEGDPGLRIVAAGFDNDVNDWC